MVIFSKKSSTVQSLLLCFRAVLLLPLMQSHQLLLLKVRVVRDLTSFPEARKNYTL